MKSSFRHPVVTSMQAALAACCLFALMPATAHAQQDDTFNRINRLEREIDTLNRAVYKGEQPASAPTIMSSSSGDSSYQANLEVRLSEMEKQLRDLTGKTEQQGFEIQQLRERLDRSQADMELRLGDLEKKNGLASPVATAPGAGMTAPAGSPPPDVPPQGTLTGVGTLGSGDMTGSPPMPFTEPAAGNAAAPITNPNAPAPANSPTQKQLGTLTEAPGGGSIAPNASEPASLYENAFSQLKSGNYVVAQRDFNGFLTAYPQHPLASNATYWLGETYYAQQKYDQASRIFAESYKKYPKGPKAADSLLKLGMSLGGSGKSKEACVSFKQLKKEFSASSSTAVRRADQEMTRLGCTV